MKAVILAGGRGERLRPLTDTIPKPMTNIEGKPFLQYQMEHLKKFNIEDIVLCVGYLAESIQRYFQNGYQFGLNITYSIENTPLGTGEH
jgi:mannose-1-phosphate guanylyltransferase/phosphomannomutase